VPPILLYIQQLLAATPFKPFTVRMNSGESIDITAQTQVTFPVSGQGVFVLLSQGHFRAYTDTSIDHVELLPT
jgi:hypothetical protein